MEKYLSQAVEADFKSPYFNWYWLNIASNKIMKFFNHLTDTPKLISIVGYFEFRYNTLNFDQELPNTFALGHLFIFIYTQ